MIIKKQKIITGVSSLLLFFTGLSDRVKAQEFVESQESDPLEKVLESEKPDVGETIEEVLGSEASEVFNTVKDIASITGEIFDTSKEIISNSKEVIENINLENLGGVLEVILGDIGLIDPQSAANNTAIGSKYSDPESPKEVDEMASAADALESEVIQRLSQIVFSKDGQSAIEQQNLTLEDSQDKAIRSIEGASNTYDASKIIGEQQIERTKSIAAEAESARAAKASQDVLKALATQKEYQAQMEQGISDQLTLLTETEVFNSVQMQGLNTQLTVLNQREQNIQSYMAGQNLQLAEIDNNLEQQIAWDKEKAFINTLDAQTGVTTLYLPGVFEGQNE